MGGGALEPKTVVGQGIEANCKKKAFTLAEVLITLAIIGVVAALTIPVVVAKYQQKMYYTQFMKMYNTLSQALELSIADNGFVTEWSELSEHEYNKFMEKYFIPYLKVSSECEDSNYSNCFGETIRMLGGAEAPVGEAEVFKPNSKIYVLADGGSIHLMATDSPRWDDKVLQFLVDTNGKKGPNTIGRDIFILDVIGKNNNGVPIESSLATFVGDEEYQADNIETQSSGVRYANCNPNESNSVGFGCADRLLIEGKMDY